MERYPEGHPLDSRDRRDPTDCVHELIEAALEQVDADAGNTPGGDPFDPILVPRTGGGIPPLTQRMVDDLIQLSEWLAGTHLGADSHRSIHDQVVLTWWKWSIRRQASPIRWTLVLLKLRRAVTNLSPAVAESVRIQLTASLALRITTAEEEKERAVSSILHPGDQGAAKLLSHFLALLDRLDNPGGG